jgi:putative FmdB family regulatory protein
VPNYEYKCTQCENQYETREGFDAPARQPCPKCGGLAKRVLFAPPIVFKGSGFYVTDSRKGSSTTVGDYNMGSTSSGTKSDGASSSDSSSTSSSDSGSSSSSSSTPAASTSSD